MCVLRPAFRVSFFGAFGFSYTQGVWLRDQVEVDSQATGRMRFAEIWSFPLFFLFDQKVAGFRFPSEFDSCGWPAKPGGATLRTQDAPPP